LSCHDRPLKICLYAMSVALVICGSTLIPSANAQQVRVVPSVSVREMYDTNVFFAPSDQLPPGLNRDDFITTIVPQINLGQTNSLMSTNLSVGAIIQKFARNSNLDNVGFNAAAGIDLGRLANRYLPRMKALRVYGTYMFSPSTPAFGAGGLGTIGGGAGSFGGGGIGLTGPLDSGQVAQRIRTSIYNIGVSNSYALSPSADFQTSLMYSSLSFGSSYTPTTTTSGQALVFDTTNYTVTAGPTARISAYDSLGFNYIFSQFSQANFGSFTTHSGQGTWGRSWSREIFSSVRGGMTLVEPIPATQSNDPNAQVSNQSRVPATIFPTGGFTLTYASASSLLRSLGSDIQSGSSPGGVGVVGGSFLPMLAGGIMPGGNAQAGAYSASFTYNLSIYPSFVSSAGPIYTHLIGINGSAGISNRLTAMGGFNFAHSSFTSQLNNSTFDTYGTILMLNYLVAPSLQASLSHQWMEFAGSSGGVATASDFSFSKQMIILGLSYAYAPRGDFFRSGAFWDTSPGASTTGTGASQPGPGGGVEIKK